jgi:CRP/FNR family transcriptional regulator
VHAVKFFTLTVYQYTIYMDQIDTSLAPLLTPSRFRQYPKGQIILYPGDKPTDVLLLQEGEVKLSNIDDDGNEKILHIFRAPALFSITYHFTATPEIIWFYTALTDAHVYRVPYQELRETAANNTEAASFILTCIAREMHELLVRVDSMSKTTASEKLIAALRFLAAHHASVVRAGWLRVRFPVTHQLLADMTGVTRESITIAMQQLQRDRVVRHPRVTVLEVHIQKLGKL